MEKNNETFGAFLRKLRKKNSLTLRRFAEILNITPSYLCDIERNNRNAPQKEHLDKMIKELNLTKEETEKFYDLARKGKPVEIAEDVKEIIISNDTIPILIRKIEEKNIDVKNLIKDIERKEKWLNIYFL